jgi:glyoxylase-like metal-dependent hydrolase (beta-lactamase superfamily II)
MLNQKGKFAMALAGAGLFSGIALFSQTGTAPLPDNRVRNVDPAQYQEVVRDVQGKIRVVAGAGSQVSVLAGDEGVLIVDDQYRQMSDKLLAAIRTISGKPVRYVINTHMHPDHVGGNDAIASMGATIFAHDNVRIRLMGGLPPGAAPAQAGNAPPPSAPPTPLGALPVVTYRDPITLHINSEEITIIPSPKPSHTDGDCFIYFKNSDVLAMGDVYTTDYPAINPGNGGTSENVIEDWNYALDHFIGPNTKIVPGHGQISARADLIALRDAVSTIRERIQKMVKDGMTLEQVKAARPTKEFDQRFALENVGRNEIVSTDAWYGIMYNEAKNGQ